VEGWGGSMGKSPNRQRGIYTEIGKKKKPQTLSSRIGTELTSCLVVSVYPVAMGGGKCHWEDTRKLKRTKAWGKKGQKTTKGN